MLKKLIVIMVIVLIVFQGVAFAASSQAVMDNTLYGGIIGGLLGGAWYLLAQDDVSHKLTTSVGIGLIAGFFMGLTEVSSFVEVEDGEMRAGIPPIIITESERYGTMYQASLLSVKY